MPIDFSLLNSDLDNSLGGLGTQPAPEPSSVIDYSDPRSILTSKKWLNASSRQRLASAPIAFDKFTKALESDKSQTFKLVDDNGEEEERPIFDPSGNYTRDGRDYLERSKAAFDLAAQMDDGGASYDSYNKTFLVDDAIGGILARKANKQPDRFSDLGSFIQEKQKIAKEGESPSLTYKEYTDFANAEIKNGEAHLDPDNKELEKAFYAETQKRTFDPASLGEEVMIGKVGNQYVMNPNNFNQIDKMEAAINGLDLSAADKKMMLIDYRSKVEENVGKIVNQFAAADAGVLGSIVSSPLRDEFVEAMSQPGASGYEFLKVNKDRLDKDSYGVGSEIAATFRDSMMATGTGALWLASFGNYTSPAEAWGGLAEDTAGAYRSGKVFDVFGVDINRRDLTELTGQIGSFIAMGGMGALAGKGLAAAGAKGAATAAAAGTEVGALAKFAAANSRYATNAQGVLLSTVAKAEAAAAAGTRTLSQKTLAGLKAIGTDPEVWLGSLQASGMSFGKTFNQEMLISGDREKALKAANIEAISDGLGAFIATSVMNRVAPGMGQAFGMGGGSVGGGIVQNLKNRALSRDSMNAVRESLENLTGDLGDGLRKQLSKDLVGVMNTSARQLGLKGYGVLGNMGAEAVEESADEIISDVISSMLDDSKTWNEEVWSNIGTKWKEYVKAGVLGSIGGAMGTATGIISSPKETFGKSEGYEIQQGEWNRLKENVQKFSIDGKYTFDGLNGQAKSLAEYIAMPKPDGVTEQAWIQKKSQALIAAAKGRVRMSMTAAMAPAGAAPVAAEPSAATGSPDVSDAAENANAEGSLGYLMELSGVQPPAGKTWRKDVLLEEDKAVALDRGRELVPLFVGSPKIGRVDYVGAKLVTRENGAIKSTTYLSPEQAASTLTLAGGKPAKNLIKGFKDRATRDTQYEYDEWSEEQNGTGNGADAAKSTSEQKGARDAGDSKGGIDRQTASSGPTITPSGAESVASTQGLTSGQRVKFTNTLGESISGVVNGPSDLGDSYLSVSFDGKSKPENVLRSNVSLEQTTAPELQSSEAPSTPLPTTTVEENKNPPPATDESKTDDQNKNDANDQRQTDDQRQIDANDQGQADDENQGQGVLTQPTAGDTTPAVSELRDVLLAELEISENSKVNERDYRNFLVSEDGIFIRKSNGEIIITDEALVASLERNDGDLNAAEADIQENIEKLKGNSSLAALDPDQVSGAAALVPQDVTYVANPELITGGVDELGGRWIMVADSKTSEGFTPKPPTYSYLPPKGQSLTLGIGQVVEIGDNPNEVLLVTNVFKGTWEFEKVNLNDARFDLITDKGRINQNNRWARTRLENIGAEFKDLFPKIADNSITRKEMEGLFKAVLKIVSPNKEFKIVEQKMSGRDYVFADPNSKAIVVDYNQLAIKFAGLYGNANINEFSNALLGMDAARVLSSILDEEIIHLLGYEEFTRKEVMSFHKSILALPKAKDGSNHPFYAMFLETLQERFPGASLDSSFRLKDENGKIIRTVNDGIYTVTSELMRKMHQLATSGTTTERATSLSRELQRMIFVDQLEITEKRSPLKVIGHMLRRYAERIRNILWMKWQQGTLAPEARQMLSRLNAAYRKAGIQGDVDFAYESAVDEAVSRRDKYEVAFKAEVGEIARFNSPALIQLRKVVNNFSNSSMEELLVVDRENMTLDLHPKVRGFIINNKLMNFEEVDQALAKLNDSSVDSPSYQKALTVASLKQQVMELQRDFLSFDPSKLFDEMRSESNGDVSKLGLWFDLLAGMPRNQISLDEMLDPLIVERNAMMDEVDLAKSLSIAEAFKAVDAIDTQKGGFKAIKQLIQWGELSQVKRPWAGKTVGKYSVATNLEKGTVARPVTGYSLDADKLTQSLKNSDRTNIAMEPLIASIEQDVEWTKKSPQEQLMEAKPEELAKMLADYKQAILQSLKLSMPVLSGADYKAFSKTLGSGAVVDSLARLNELEGELAILSSNIQTLRASGQRLVDNADLEAELAEKVQSKKDKRTIIYDPSADNVMGDRSRESTSVTEEANRLYRQYMEFSKSVEEYNDAIQFVKRRALGDFTVNNRGHGLNLYDLNVSTGTGNNLKYTSYTDQLTPAFTSDEVFQGVVEDKLPTDDNRFAYGYASRFFYPREVNGVKQPLSDYQQAWNDGLEIYRSKMSSNADFIGKASFLNFWVNKQLGNIRAIGLSESYEQTGGFNFEKIVNESDADIYVKSEDAFPELEVGKLGSIKRGLGSTSGNSKPILELVKFVQQINAWSQQVRSNYQDGYESSVLETIGGEQTLAARMVPMLDKFFSRLQLVEDDRIATVVYSEGLDSDLKTFFGSVMAVLQNHFEINDKFMIRGEFALPDGQLEDFMDVFKYDDNGQLIKRSGDSTSYVAVAKNLSDKLFGDAMQSEGFEIKLRNASSAVSLVRKTLRGFQKTEWRKNVEKEGSRYQRDPAYNSGNVAMLKLRENVADAGILGNLGWAIEYFERPRDYVFGANWAFELLKGIEESNYGEGREPFVRVTQSTKGRETTPQERFDFSEGEGDPNNRFVAGVNRIQTSTYSEVNSDSQVVGPYDYAGEDDSRVSMFTGGETVSTVKGYRDTYNSGAASTPFESAQRAYGRASVTRAMKLTVAALFIGSNSATGRSSAAGKQFYFDMMRAERESGWFTAEDVIAERVKAGPAQFGLITDPISGESRPRYTDADISAMEQTELRRVFARAMNDNLLRRGLQGLFPGFKASGVGRFGSAIYDAFMSEYGRGNAEDGYAYEFQNSETFITDLLSFKTKFERRVVENARVKNEDDNVEALKTVLAATNEPSEQFANLDKALKKKNGKGFQLASNLEVQFGKRPNNFVSDAEATAIAKLIHEGIMNEKYVLADTRLGIGMGSGNGIIDHLVDTLPGRTLVLSIDVNKAARSGLGDVGLRVFQGDKTSPNVIYFPTNQAGAGFRGEQGGGVIAQLLRISADVNPKVAEKLREMAGTMRDALNPAKHAEEGRLIHWRSNKKRYSFIPATVSGMQTSLRLRLLSGDTEIGNSLTDIDPLLAADIVLISEVLSSEDAKVLLDNAYSAIDLQLGTDLPSAVEKDIMDSIRQVRMKELDAVGRFDDEVDDLSYRLPDEETEEEEEATVDGPGELQDLTDPLEISENPFFADRDLNDAQLIVEQSGEINPEMARVKRMQDFGLSDRSDVFLFNGIASIVEAGKRLNGQVSEEQSQALRDSMDRRGEARDASPRSLLAKQTLSGKNELEKVDVALSGALIESPTAKAGRIYVGEAKNLTMPKAGGRTALNLAFYDTRINNVNASILHRVASIEVMINQKALTQINQSLETKARDNKQYNVQNGNLAALGFSRQDVKIELTDELIEELKASLPKGVIEAAMNETQESVANLESNKQRLQETLVRLKEARQASVLLDIESSNQDALSDPTIEAFSATTANALRITDRQIARVERDLFEINQALSEIDHHPSLSNIGRTYFRGEVGVEAQVDPRSGKVIADAVQSSARSVGINLSFSAPGTASEVETARWNDFSSDAAQADIELKARRREHYIREQAVMSALTKLSTDHIDDAYRLVRNTTDNFLSFDPLKVIRQAVEMSEVESLVMKEQMAMARTDAETAKMRGLSADAIAILTDPLNPEKVMALKRNQQKKMQILNLPKSAALRREKIGSLFSQEGESIVLAPTTVREQLLTAFPRRVSKRNVESVLSHTALSAIDLNQNTDEQLHSYFLGTVDAIKDQAFDGNEFNLTRDLALTKEEAGKVFSKEYLRKLQVFLDAIRNQSDPNGKKKVDLTQSVTQKQIRQYQFMIELMVMAYNDEKKFLSEPTKKQVSELLTSISDSGVKSFSSIEVDPFTGRQLTLNMMRFRVEEAFSKVFSEIEGELINNRLASGMSIHNDRTSLFTMKYLHHQDARIRNRFRRTYAARQTALHLNAFLERGIDGKSGRSAYETSKKEVQNTIAESAKLVGDNSLDHTLGYFHSILSGLDQANGLNYVSAFKEFVRQAVNGFNQMDDFVTTQNNFYGKNKLSKYWNGTHIDMVRDHELSMKVRSIIRKSIEGREPSDEAAARAIVERVQNALLSATSEGKRDAVKSYSETLVRVLGDIDTAMHVTMAMLSKEGKEPVNEAKSRWKHTEVRSFKRTYSSVPMKFGYAARPGTKAKQVVGRYVSDAIDVVAFDDASFFGGIGRSSKQYDDKSVYRPISVNGLIAPLSLIDDAIYRLNVTPTYEVLRRAIGQVVDEKGVLSVQDGDVLARLERDAPDITNPDPKYHMLKHQHDQRMESAKTALASVANEFEQVIHNDSQVGVVNTGGAEVLRFASSAFIVRSLASVQQMWDQTSGPSLGYVSGKLAIGKPKMAADYLKIIGLYLSKKQFRIAAKKFIMDTAPPVYYRSSDGRDVVKDESRGQKRYGGSNTKNVSGKLVRQYEKLGEDAIHFTIGAGERMLATASFLAELMDQMKVKDLDGLLRGNYSDQMNIMHVINSQKKVNDLMAQSDQSKKSWMFQSRETSPGMSALWRALVQFSNHTSSMASNMTVMIPMAFSKVDKNAGRLDGNGNIIPPMDGFIDEKSHEEALENVVTTLVQNILFAPFKAKSLVLILAYIIARSMGDDDEDAVRNAQEMANKVLAPQEDGNAAANIAKMLVFGKQRELFRSDLDPDAAFASALAETLAKSSVELVTAIPLVGVAAGYSPVSGLAQKFVLNDAAESAVAFASGLPKSKFYFDDDGVQVRSYDGGWADNATGITAPTSAAMDLLQAGKLLIDYNLTTGAADNRVDSAFNSSIYALTEAVPFLRDARGYMKGKLTDAIKEEKD